jgi:hypothetical protein
MPLTLPTYAVVLDVADGDPVEFTVTVRHGDRLRAELEAPRHLPPHATDARRYSFHTMTLWVWAAAVREGKFGGGAREFIDAALDVSPETIDPDEVATVDPTRTAPPSGSP